jgi:hypothetical protein
MKTFSGMMFIPIFVKSMASFKNYFGEKSYGYMEVMNGVTVEPAA